MFNLCSSKSNEDEKPDAESASTSSNVENITQDNGEETVSERQNKDVDVTEKKDEMKEVKEKEKKEEEEKEKEADIDAEVQEEQQVSESESTDVKADEKLVTEKETEESSEDALGTRFVILNLTLMPRLLVMFQDYRSIITPPQFEPESESFTK